MVVARIAMWKFKQGMRRTGFDKLEEAVTRATREAKGFRGSLVLLSIDDPNVGIIITLWASDNSLKAYARGVFQDTVRELEEFVVGPPKVETHRVFSAELKH